MRVTVRRQIYVAGEAIVGQLVAAIEFGLCNSGLGTNITRLALECMRSMVCEHDVQVCKHD